MELAHKATISLRKKNKTGLHTFKQHAEKSESMHVKQFKIF